MFAKEGVCVCMSFSGPEIQDQVQINLPKAGFSPCLEIITENAESEAWDGPFAQSRALQKGPSGPSGQG